MTKLLLVILLQLDQLDQQIVLLMYLQLTLVAFELDLKHLLLFVLRLQYSR